LNKNGNEPFFIGNPSGGKITGNLLSFLAFKKRKKENYTVSKKYMDVK